MRAVVTVTGKDKKGIIAKVSAFLAEKGVNVEDIKVELSELAKECEQMGSEIGMSVRLQHEAIFNAMHNI